MTPSPTRTLLIALLCLTVHATFAQLPEWIWSKSSGANAAAGEVRFFRKTFVPSFEVQQATLAATGDDEITLFLNGHEVGHAAPWMNPLTVDVAQWIRPG